MLKKLDIKFIVALHVLHLFLIGLSYRKLSVAIPEFLP